MRKPQTLLAVTPAQAVEIDRAATERFGIPSILLMENAGRAAADEAMKMLRKVRGPVAVVLGKGKNAGDGLVVVRTLHNRGVDVRLYRVFDEIPEEEDVGANLRMARALGLAVEPLPFARPALVVDAIFGIGLSRDVTGPAKEAIDAINGARARVLAIDVPSGLDATTGLPRGAAVRAHTTVTMGFLKTGFRSVSAKKYTGKIVVAEIGYPRELLLRNSDAERPNR